MTAVVVAICTFRRPELLGRLLASVTACQRNGVTVSAVVVDNDSERSAERIVEEAGTAGCSCRYVSEPTRGISVARNRLATEALVSAPDYVVFLDDDEWVTEQWLHAAVATASASGAGSVAGPVLPVYGESTPLWIRRGGFFERPRYVTGQLVQIGNIGNVLVATGRLRELMPSPFGTGFVDPGGEDTYFLHRFYAHGGTTAWCDEAVVHEIVPRERASAGWLLRRAFHGGANYTRCLRMLHVGRRAIFLRTATCALRVVQGMVVLPIAAVRGRHRGLAAAMVSAAGIGGLVAVGRGNGSPR